MNEHSQALVALETARAVTVALAESLPTSADPSQFTSKSDLPFKALSIRELLIHRVSSLANTALTLFEQDKYLPAVIITRSLLETIAVAGALQRALNRAVRTLDYESLNRFLVRLLVPSLEPDANHEAMNITSLVDAIDKKVPGYRATYNAFSEYVHPNWSGMLGTFGKVDPETRVLHLGIHEESAVWGVGVYGFAGVLEEFHKIYASLPPLITQLNTQLANDA